MESSVRLFNPSSNPKQGRRINAQLKNLVLELIDSSSQRMTPASLTKTIGCDHPDFTRSMIRLAIQSLVESGDLSYSNHFGQTYIEFNYNRATHITDRIILSPPHCTSLPSEGDVHIKINNGASFGLGDHPTTRIALRGVEYAMNRIISSSGSHRMKTLDIGTGSGVLAIASVKLGATEAVGLDLDPVACYEARTNVDLNNLNPAIAIFETELEQFAGERYELIMANLRPPTLKQIIPTLHQYSSPLGLWVFSGMREEEARGMTEDMGTFSANTIWQSSEQGWAGMVVEWHESNGN